MRTKRKITTSALAAVALLCPGAGTMGADIVKDGKAASVICIQKNEASPVAFDEKFLDNNGGKKTIAQPQVMLNTALFDIRDYVKKMSGAELEVKFIKTPDEIPAQAIVVGELAGLCGVKPESKNEHGEAYRIQSDAKRIYISGGSKRGTAYGIYELLNRLGVDWVMPDTLGEVYPETKNISFAAMAVDEAPSFKMRAPWMGGMAITKREVTQFHLWQLRSKEQWNRNLTPEQMLGHHTWQNYQAKKYDTYFEKNPEIAPLIRQADGTEESSRYQIDCTVPAAVNMVADSIREMFETNKWAKDKRVTISVGPADGRGFFESDASIVISNLRRDPITGEQDLADMLVQFANTLLERLTLEYPNLYLGFYLYHIYEDFPVKVKPHPHLMIQIADISHSRFHGMCDAGVSPQRAYYKSVLERWAKKGNVITLYHYNWNLADAVMPYSRLRIIGEDMPAEHKMGIHGYGCEYHQNVSVTAPHDYLQSRLMWNITRDWKQVTREFCEKTYGKDAAPLMEKFYMFICAKQAESPDESGAFFAFPHVYSIADIRQMREWLNRAEQLAQSPKEKRRVQIAAHPRNQLENYLEFYNATNKFDFKSAVTALEKLHKTQADIRASDYPQAASGWSKDFFNIFLKPFASAAEKYSTGDYQSIAKLPEKMKVMFDPNNAGEQMNLQSPRLRDDSFLQMSTYASTFSQQGQIAVKNGTVWYRTTLKLPELKLKDGEGVGLFIAGGDHIINAWVNGVKVGRINSFLKPCIWDITDYAAKNGELNSIVISVTRKVNNEVGTGGLMFPSFVFQGPRLTADDKNPQAGEFKTILPGTAT